MKEKERILSRGQLARFVDLNLETIRFYENKGLLPKPLRSSAGHRQYGQVDVQQLAFIRRSQELGFTLQEIGELLSLRAAPRRSRGEVKKIASEKLEAISRKIHDLQRMQRTLRQICENCSGRGTTSACPILEALDGESHSYR